MEFDKKQYKIYTWKNWMVLHWILNPGLVINDLLLGQKIPKLSLEDKTIDKPRPERTFVPCPHCNTLHDGRIWSTQNGTAFKNWFGLYCINCGKIIPCLMNGLSFLLLALTFPLWGWFKEKLKSKWLEKQPERYANIDVEHIPNPFDKKSWVKTGLIWGAFMFLFTTLLNPFFTGQEITLERVLIGLVVWPIGGLGFGYIMKLFVNKKGSKKANDIVTDEK